jgi:hypothetical protein
MRGGVDLGRSGVRRAGKSAVFGDFPPWAGDVTPVVEEISVFWGFSPRRGDAAAPVGGEICGFWGSSPRRGDAAPVGGDIGGFWGFSPWRGDVVAPVGGDIGGFWGFSPWRGDAAAPVSGDIGGSWGFSPRGGTWPRWAGKYRALACPVRATLADPGRGKMGMGTACAVRPTFACVAFWS